VSQATSQSPTVDVFGRMNALARTLGAVNLGHGFPEDHVLDVLVEGATRAMREERNQYSPSEGLAELRQALARRSERRGVAYDPDAEVTVTAGCSEALVTALMAVAPPGSEAIALEPFYDLYPDFAAVAGVRLVTVPLRGVGGSGDPTAGLVDAVREAIGPATRALVLNSPHNPSGVALAGATLAALGELAVEHDLVVISDDVYDEFVYDAPHERIAALPGLRERTISCSSATKTLSVSGWRVGWACAPAELTTALRDAHRAITFCAPTPLQAGVADALEWADQSGFFDRQRRDYARRRDILVEGLTAAGLDVTAPAAGYFVVADVRRWSGGADVAEFAVRLAHDAGVVTIPLTTSVLTTGAGDHLLRFAFCKSEEAIVEASRRLRRYAATRLP
jgi:N-succinyldiaminopimelate aminotransferase